MAARLPSLNALRAFEATARRLSVTLAADELSVTQSAVSRHIRALEEDLGVTLFRRLHRSIRLTPEGEALARTLTEAFETIRRGVEQVRSRPGELRVRVPPTFGTRWLLPRLPAFEAAHPGITVRVSVLWDKMTPEDAEHDVGIVFSRGRWADDQLIPLMRERLAPVCAPAFLQRFGPIDDLERIRATLLLHCSGHQDWRAWLDGQGRPDIDSDRGEVFDTMDMGLRAAEGGRGLAIADLNVIRDDLAIGRLIEIFPGRTIEADQIYAVRRDVVRPRADVSAFIGWLVAEAVAA